MADPSDPSDPAPHSDTNSADSPPSKGHIIVGTFEPSTSTFYIDGKPVYSYTTPSPALPRALRPRPQLNPARFVGPKLKIERAKCHIRDLEAAIKAFHDTNPYELIHEKDPQTGENVYRVRVKEPLPVKLSGIIGDIVHNLRSALDHLICDLIRAATGKEVSGDKGFPIFGDAKRFKPGRVSKINGVGSKAERLVLRLKPYKGGNAALWNLHMLDVLDKHNGIVPVAAATMQVAVRAAMPFFFQGPNGEFRLGGPGPDGKPFYLGGPGIPHTFQVVYPLKDNIEIHRSPGALNEQIDVVLMVAFDKGQVAEGQPVFETLQQYADLIERILGIFEKHAL